MGSAHAALSVALDLEADRYSRIYGLRAVAELGTAEQRQELVDGVLGKVRHEHARVLSELCDAFYPSEMSDSKLLRLLEVVPPPGEFEYSGMQSSLEKITDSDLGAESAGQLLGGLQKLLARSPHIERQHCEISSRYVWVLPGAMKIVNQLVLQRHPIALSPAAIDICRGYVAAQRHQDLRWDGKKDFLASVREWPEFGLELLWRTIWALEARRLPNSERALRLWDAEIELHGLWEPTSDQLEGLFAALSSRQDLDQKIIAVEAIFRIYVEGGRPRPLRERMKRASAEFPEVRAHLQGLLRPPPLSEKQRKSRQRRRQMDRRQQERRQVEERNRKGWQAGLREQAQDVRNVGDPAQGTVFKRTTYLYDRLREVSSGNDNRLGYSDWRSLVPEFGEDLARSFRDGCIEYWRGHDPFSFDEWRTSSSIPWPRIIGLTGLAMEAGSDAGWAQRLVPAEAQIASRYALCELNGFPPWAAAVRERFREVFDESVKRELAWEIQNAPESISHLRCLSSIRYGPPEIRRAQVVNILGLLEEGESSNGAALYDALGIVMGEDLSSAQLSQLTRIAASQASYEEQGVRKQVWLTVLACLDGDEGLKELVSWLDHLETRQEKIDLMVQFCSGLFGNDRTCPGSRSRDYERSAVLSELVPLVFEYITPEEDNLHDGSYSPDTRDNAESARSYLLNKMLDTPGRATFDALVRLSELATDGNSRDWMMTLARKRAALDADGEPWSGVAVADFANSGEISPRTEEDLHSIALSQLDEIRQDLEEGDDSEAGLWMKANEETELRTVLAGRLSQASRQRYTVGSEEELADATRTDIRLNAPSISAPVPIELKIANKWSGRKLMERLENQLVGQYMRSSTCGVFLLIKNHEKRWEEPGTRRRMSFEELVAWLQREADILSQKHSNVTDLQVVGIDLTVRLRTKSGAPK